MNLTIWPLKWRGCNWRLVFACFAMLLLWLPLSVRAQPKCTPAANATATVPAAIYEKPGLPIGGALTSWFPLFSGSAPMYECKGNALFGAAVSVAGLLKSAIQVPYKSSGLPISVFDTNVPGVGVAFALTLNTAGCSSGVLDAGGLPSAVPEGTVQSSPSYGVWFQCKASAGSDRLLVSVEMMFVKTGAISGGTVTPSVPLLRSSYSMDGALKPGTWGVMAGSTVVHGPSSCNVQDVTVAMGSYKSSAFSGVGSLTPAKNFEVSVTCPPGMMLVTSGTSARPMAIGYKIYVNGAKMLATGVVALSPDSTAKGIGLRLSNSTASPLVFGFAYPLEYDATSGSSHSVKFQAAYQQVAATVTPGTANAVLIFAMNYQ